MIFGRRRSSRGPAHSRTFLFVDINERCRPDARDALYAGPIDDALRRVGLGEVTGAGTAFAPDGEPVSSGVDIETVDRAAAEELVIEVLNEAGVAKGTFIVGGDPPVETARFGVSEGVGIYVNGTDLPVEVYAEFDVNVDIEDLSAALTGLGELRGWWDGPRETAIYFYGPSAAAIRSTAEAVIAGRPLFELARIVDLPTRETE